jgi:thioredoxin reductase (NADPH)
MNSVLVGLLVAVALLVYFWWTLRERRMERAAVRVIEDLRVMGDAVPTSLHPKVDPTRCIGSGACVTACPEDEVIAIVDRRARLANPLACIGHGACMEACPVKAIELVFGSELRGVEIPKISEHFETTRKGVYVVGELAGMGLIRNAISQGRQAAEHIVKAGRRGGAGALDAIVVGAGPAGISATLSLMEAGLRVLCLEREQFGGTVMHYPRAKVVMTGAIELPLVGRIKRRTMSKEDLVGLWESIRAKATPPVLEGELIQTIRSNEGDEWIVTNEKGEARKAANVILALGRRGAPRKLGVPGEETGKVHYRVLEPAEFRGKHVLVVGGGNSAVETALALLDHGQCAEVSISYRRPSFERCRAENKARITQEIQSGRIRALLPSTVSRIDSASVVLKDGAGREGTIRNDAVVVQIGGTPPSELLSGFGIESVTKYGEA